MSIIRPTVHQLVPPELGHRPHAQRIALERSLSGGGVCIRVSILVLHVSFGGGIIIHHSPGEVVVICVVGVFFVFGPGLARSVEDEECEESGFMLRSSRINYFCAMVSYQSLG
jgi:hypothetical protein